MNIFNRTNDKCAIVRAPIPAHSHIRGSNRATGLIKWCFQHCAGSAHSSHFSTIARTLQNSAIGHGLMRFTTVNDRLSLYCAIVQRQGSHIRTIPMFARTFTRTIGSGV
jgi:hypothetical protein